MADYLTEQEQIEQLKSWIKQYGLTVLLGIVIALVITTSWRYWQAHRHKILQQASILYDEMLIARAENNNAIAVQTAKKITAEYTKTPYADMAALLLARNAVMNKDYQGAATELTWVIDHGHADANRLIARARLARIFIAENKPDPALNILNVKDNPNYIGLFDSIRGDAYLAKNNKAEARQYYQLALQELPNAEVTQPVLEMKLNNLAKGP